VDIRRPDLQPWRTHLEPRWWDRYRRRYAAGDGVHAGVIA
jgi:hypothetical protein